MKKIVTYIILNLVFLGAFASKVEVKTTENGFQLLKDGKPYYIKGAGGTVELEKLKSYGGNSIRTWGISPETDAILEEAHKNGITVTFGIWMGQERQGFDYSNEGAIKAQVEEFRRVVRKYKNHPAILLWGVGNEMDLDYTNFDVWKYLEELVKMIHEEDPNHPTMAVTAGLDVAEVKLINKHTPSLDILGVNTYGDISYLPEAIKVYGWKKTLCSS
ncbi:MAG: glycoside hydrolase family 2 TIM barrel-domain containing protein [Flavobacteriales bacterium]